jgi:hypothetical protein
MRRIVLSDPVPVEALVSRYLTNKLIGLGPLQCRKVSEEVPSFDSRIMKCNHIIRYYLQFPAAIPKHWVRYPSITRPFATRVLFFIPKESGKPFRSTCMF